MRLVAVVLASLLLVPLAGARVPIQSQPYTGEPVGAGCAEIHGHPCPRLANSHVQFGPFRGHDVLDVTVMDKAFAKVGAAYTIFDQDGLPLAAGSFCQSARLLAPDGSAYLVLDVDSPLNGMHCALGHVGTVGHVDLRLR
jgi:hypothetical protein